MLWFFIKKFVLLTKNTNQSETGIGDKILSVELYDSIRCYKNFMK